MTRFISRFEIVAAVAALAATAALLAFPQQSEAAIQFGGATSQPFHCGTPVNCEALDEVFAFAAPTISGSNTVLLIAVSLNDLSLGVPDFVTYDGVDLGAADFDSGAVNFTRTLVWVVTNPASAKLVDMQVGPSGQNGVITATYYTGVNQVKPYRTVTTGTGTSNPGSLSVTNSRTDDLVAGFFSTNDTSAANGLTEARVGAGQTYRLTTVNSSAESQLAFSDEPGVSGSVTHSWDFVDDGNNGWAGVAIPLVPAVGALQKPPNNLGLVGYWSFDDGVGTRAGDFSGNGNAGTLLNSPTWVNGKRSKALNFNGSNSGVNVGTSASLDPTIKTISAWIYPRSLGGGNFGTIMASALNGSSLGWYLQLCSNDAGECPSAANTLVYRHYDPSHIFSDEWRFPANSVQFNTWQHVVVVFDASSDGNTPVFYINGSAVAATQTVNDGAPTSAGTTDTKYIGTDPNNSGFDGLIDEARIYNRALGATEIAALAGLNRGSSGAAQIGASTVDLQRGSSLSSGLVGHWTFDGPDVTTVVADKSGQSNSGYFVGGATTSAKISGKFGQALNFNGTTNYVSLGAPASLDVPACTIAAWVKTTNDNDEAVFAASEGAGVNLFTIEFGPSTPGLTNELITVFSVVTGLNAGYTTANRAELFDGTWHHVAVAADDTQTRIYLDGVSKTVTVGGGTDSGDCLQQNVWNTARIGGQRYSDSDINFFNGAIDDVRFYNRALTATEVKQLYNLGATTLTP